MGTAGLQRHRAGQGRRAAAVVATRPADDLRGGGRHQPLQGQEDRGPAAAGARRAEPAAAVRHRRRGREPAAERPHPGRQGPPLQGIHRPAAGAAHPGRPGRLAPADRAARRGFERELADADRRSATRAAAEAEALEARLLEADDRDRRDQRGDPRSRRRRSPPTASGSPAANRPSSTSGAAAATWNRKSPATAGSWRR